MRQLTEVEFKLANKAFADCTVEGSGLGRIDRPLFHAGFIAGLDHAQAKIKSLEAFIAGKITRDELEKVTK